MTKLFKSIVFEFFLYALGYIAYVMLRGIGRMTLTLGRTVFSR